MRQKRSIKGSSGQKCMAYFICLFVYDQCFELNLTKHKQSINLVRTEKNLKNNTQNHKKCKIKQEIK